MIKFRSKKHGLAGVWLFFLAAGNAAFGQEINIRDDGLVEYIAPAQVSATQQIDFAGAQALPLPSLPSLPSIPPGAELPGGFRNQEFGDLSVANPWQKPFTTKRAATSGNGTPATRQPYAAAGKLFFTVGNSSFVCSGALVRPGVVITAAHCVAPFGQATFYQNFVFVPGKHGGIEPYGQWEGASAMVKREWFNGTDNCLADAPGIVCANDVAVIRLKAKFGNGSLFFAGDSNQAGRLGVSANNNAFNFYQEAMITQLGYPVSHDSGLMMQETNSESSRVQQFVENNVIGSRQTGGSSGGPWIVNHGNRGQTTVPDGNFATRNIIVGVTSWGYTNNSVHIQGASKFTFNNAVKLIFGYCPIGATNRFCIE